MINKSKFCVTENKNNLKFCVTKLRLLYSANRVLQKIRKNPVLVLHFCKDLRILVLHFYYVLYIINVYIVLQAISLDRCTYMVVHYRTMTNYSKYPKGVRFPNHFTIRMMPSMAKILSECEELTGQTKTALIREAIVAHIYPLVKELRQKTPEDFAKELDELLQENQRAS